MGAPPENLTSQKEIAALKQENERLRRMVPSKHDRRAAKYVKRMSVIVLVSLSVVLLSLANLFFWFGNTVVKQDRFVAATEPLIKDPAVQSSMSLYITNTIFKNIDVQAITASVLPPRADFLAPQLTTQLKGYAQSSLQKILASQNLQNKWNQTLAKQHQRLVSFAAKYQGDDTITLNDVYSQAVQNLNTTKLAFLANKQLPAKVGQITLINAAWLPAFHNLVVNIDTWRLLSVILLVCFMVLAVWLSRARRKTIYAFSLAVTLTMLATLIGLHVIKDSVLGKVDPAYASGVAQALKIVFHSLVWQTLTIMATGALVAIIAWVSGPAARAQVVRGWAQQIFAGDLHQKIFRSSNKFSDWVGRQRRFLEWGTVAIVAAIMLLVRLTILGLLLYALLMLLVIIIIETIGGSTNKS